jgi:hypothetical protein
MKIPTKMPMKMPLKRPMKMPAKKPAEMPVKMPSIGVTTIIGFFLFVQKPTGDNLKVIWFKFLS